MVRTLALTAALVWVSTSLAAAPDAGLPDAGPRDAVDAGRPLTVAECSALVDRLLQLSVTEALGRTSDFQALSPSEKKVAEGLAREEVQKDPAIAELKRQCLTRYHAPEAACLRKAQTMDDVDACK
jgi:hypothetical protein